MTVDLFPLATGIVTAGVTSWVTYRFGRTQGRHNREMARRETATQALTEALRELCRLVRRHGCVEVSEAEVAGAFAAWFDAFDRHHTRLPERWQHLGRSIRCAVGTVFGASSFIDLRPDVETYPLEEPDSLWQTFADDYLGYCLDSLVRWSDDDLAVESLVAYDKWLVRTGRRDPFGQNQPA